MSTFCHGIASCQALDKSGEIVEISGLDITSLPKTGILNYEHKSDVPGQICGKILSAKKIHTAKDCSNEHETYFWNKCRVPFVYITAELLDDYCQSGKDAAGLFRYDHDKKGQNKHAILGFSVEGSEIPNTRRGMVITRSIARKVTLTASPCNSLCTAELLEQKVPSQVKDDFDSIFKSQEEAITLFKSGEGEKIYEQFLAKKEMDEPSATPAPTNFKPSYQDKETKDVSAGKMRSGKNVMSHGPSNAYGFNPQEHQEQNEHHARAKVMATNPKLGVNRQTRAADNKVALQSDESVQHEAARSLKAKDSSSQATGKESKASLMGKSEKICKHKVKKDEFGFPDSPKPSASPGEPNKANAQAMQNGAMNGGPSFSQGMSNLANGLMGKSENFGWSKGKVDKDNKAVHFEHPTHGTVSVIRHDNGDFHVKHNGVIAGVGGVKGSFPSSGEAGTHAKKYMSAVSQGKIMAPKMHNISSTALMGKKPLAKAIDAGSYNAAPSTLTSGAAYQKESMSSKPATTGAENHKFHGTKKKDWNKRSKEDYENWDKREEFENFMRRRLPHLAIGEIKAIGRCISLKKNIDFEKSLSDLLPKKK